MKKLFAFGLLMAMPASAAVIVTSSTPVQLAAASPWVDAPLAIGGYAYIKGQGKCCTIVRITDMVISADSYHQQIWITTFYSDSSGNWPVDDPYWRTSELRFNGSDLQGVTLA
jgi:hypothetical protein